MLIDCPLGRRLPPLAKRHVQINGGDKRRDFCRARRIRQHRGRLRLLDILTEKTKRWGFGRASVRIVGDRFCYQRPASHHHRHRNTAFGEIMLNTASKGGHKGSDDDESFSGIL
jgi:hypothetical protein